MKIGEISHKYNLSIDTIRYYIDLGLIIPDKKEKQYIFDDKSVSDIETIVKLKDLHFALKDIHRILSLTRISNLVEEKDLDDIIEIFENHKSQLAAQKVNLEKAILDINKEIEVISKNKRGVYEPTGVPIAFMPYLFCPNCNEPLTLKDAYMKKKYIYEGKLVCECGCGYNAVIKDGIIITENRNTSLYDSPDLKRELYKDIPSSIISLFQKSYNWMYDKLIKLDLQNKIVLETHINAFFFLHTHFAMLDKNALYLIVDKFPEMLVLYKGMIDRMNLNLNILYLADNSMNWPIKKHCVDIFIDYFGNNEYAIYKDAFIFEELEPFLTPNAETMGTFFHFNNFSGSFKLLKERYPETYENNFNLTAFKEDLRLHKFKMIDEQDIASILDSGENRAFNFHKKGEKMTLHSFYAKKD